MKKWIPFVLALLLAFCLFGCSADETSSEITGAVIDLEYIAGLFDGGN